MKLCRFHLPGQGARLGQVVAQQIYDLSSSGLSHFTTLTALLQTSTTTAIGSLLQNVDLPTLPAYVYAELDRPPAPDVPHLLPPVDRQEVWAAGVTYAWSREARVREAHSKEIYVRVYEAKRPELFLKSLGEKVVGPNNWIGLRGDSHWNVPEPELALILNPSMHIVGYTIGNDVSSRDIEGENPLYLPQAKVYRHACALGPVIALLGESADVSPPIDDQNLAVRLTIRRGVAGQSRHKVPADAAESAGVVFQGQTSTAKIHRSLTELVGYLGRYNDFPYGAALLTGTGIVPDDDFTLLDGDLVSIEIEGVGVLHNPARQM
jgi:2-dehydro-3-deoxy-D-arabinonate dehydratase